jgi:hypothetical protein
MPCGSDSYRRGKGNLILRAEPAARDRLGGLRPPLLTGASGLVASALRVWLLAGEAPRECEILCVVFAPSTINSQAMTAALCVS